jgi:hypothetical protein
MRKTGMFNSGKHRVRGRNEDPEETQHQESDCVEPLWCQQKQGSQTMTLDKDTLLHPSPKQGNSLPPSRKISSYFWIWNWTQELSHAREVLYQ